VSGHWFLFNFVLSDETEDV